MKPKRTTTTVGNAAILSAAAAICLLPQSLHAANVNLTASNPAGTTSFATATSWSDSTAPSGTNDYFVASAFSLRTLADGGNASFAGNSLTLGDNTTAGILLLKNANNAIVTVNNLTLNNGEIQNGGTSSGAATTVTIAGGITLASSTAANRINSGGAGRRIIVTAPIGGGGALVASGGGNVTLSGSNSYGGGTSITGSTTLNINGDAALGAVPVSPSTNLTFTGSGILFGGATTIALDANRGIQINTGATATFQAGGTTNVLTLNGAVSNQSNTGNFSLATNTTNATTGTVVLAGSNTFATGSTISLGGGTNLGGGILRLANSNALGSNAVTLNAAGGNSNWIGAVELSGGVTIGSNATLNISGHNQGGTSADNLRNLSGNNAFNGSINITGTGGAYQINSDEAGSTLTIGGNINNTLNSSRTLNFIGAGDTTVNGSLAQTGPTGTLLVVAKSGNGTLTLSNTSVYTGATTVSAGTLFVNGSLGNTAVAVTGGTLGGTGSIAGTVAVSGTGKLAAGTSIESLATGALTMSVGSTFAYEAANNSSIGADLVAVNGTLSLTDVTLDLTGSNLASGTWVLGDKVTLISYMSGGVTSGFTGFLDNTVYTYGSNEWRFDYNDTTPGTNYASDTLGSTSFVTMTVIPEPTVALLSGFGLLALLRRRRM
ncbi:MAG: autotransporter-associated beta strand repeat-containing protein [Verrucomicrobiota bacterium]